MDKLMGIGRDKAEKDKTGDEFSDKSICKHHLVGFCPDGLIGKRVQKDRNPMDVTPTMPVPCTLTHSNAMKEQYEKHPKPDKYRKEYEGSLLRRLEEIVSECDRRVFFGKKKCTPPKEPEFKLSDTKLEKVYKEYKAEKDELTKQCVVKGEAGDVKGAQEVADEIRITQKKIDVIVETHTDSFPGEGCCDVCAGVYLLGPKRYYTHGQKDFTGWVSEEEHPKDKTHMAYVEIREWLAKCRDQRKEDDGNGKRSDAAGQRRRSQSRRSRSRDKDNAKDRDRSKEKKDSKDKDSSKAKTDPKDKDRRDEKKDSKGKDKRDEKGDAKQSREKSNEKDNSNQKKGTSKRERSRDGSRDRSRGGRKKARSGSQRRDRSRSRKGRTRDKSESSSDRGRRHGGRRGGGRR